MAQFRVEFVRDEASGRYLAELYHPERENEVMVRTEPLYPTQEAALLGVVQLFQGAIPQVSRPARRGRRPKKAERRGKAGKAAKKKAAKRRRKHR